MRRDLSEATSPHGPGESRVLRSRPGDDPGEAAPRSNQPTRHGRGVTVAAGRRPGPSREFLQFARRHGYDRDELIRIIKSIPSALGAAFEPAVLVDLPVVGASTMTARVMPIPAKRLSDPRTAPAPLWQAVQPGFPRNAAQPAQRGPVWHPRTVGTLRAATARPAAASP
jgi:hypothetical protein